MIGSPDKVKIIDPRLTTTGLIHDNLRIFTTPSKQRTETARCDPRSCNLNGNTNAKAGISVWFGTNNPKNSKAPVGKNIPQSNNSAELLAIHMALKLTPSNTRLHIKTDSDWSIKALCKNIDRHTDVDFIHITHTNLLKPIVNKMRKRAGMTSFEWIKGHNGTTGNEEADRLAAEGARENNLRNKIFITSPEHNYSGTRLAALMQKDAYKLISKTSNRKVKEHKSTETNLDLTRHTYKT